MDDKNDSLFVVAYSGKDTANQVYEVLRGLEKAKKIDIKTAAVVNRKPNGKLRLKHKRRVTVWKGGIGGGALGLLLAALTPVGGGAALAGAVVGALVGTSRSGGRRDAKKFLVDKLGQDDSALILLVEDADWNAIHEATESYGGESLVVDLSAAAEAQIARLAEDEEVAEAISEEVEVIEEDVE